MLARHRQTMLVIHSLAFHLQDRHPLAWQVVNRTLACLVLHQTTEDVGHFVLKPSQLRTLLQGSQHYFLVALAHLPHQLPMLVQGSLQHFTTALVPLDRHLQEILHLNFTETSLAHRRNTPLLTPVLRKVLLTMVFHQMDLDLRQVGWALRVSILELVDDTSSSTWFLRN